MTTGMFGKLSEAGDLDGSSLLVGPFVGKLRRSTTATKPAALSSPIAPSPEAARCRDIVANPGGVVRDGRAEADWAANSAARGPEGQAATPAATVKRRAASVSTTADESLIWACHEQSVRAPEE